MIEAELASGLAFVALFSASALAGAMLRKRLHERHLSAENMEAIRLVTGLLVTFAALVLSLQLSTTKSAFDSASRNRSNYAARLANLDQCLRGLGPTTDPARMLMRRYTAAVIASTWPREPAPRVDGMPDPSRMAVRGEDPALSQLMNQIGADLDALAPSDRAGANAAARCRDIYSSVVSARWAVIEDTHTPSGAFFIAILSFWLSLVFLSFGVQAPRRALSAIVLAIGVVSVASVMFVIVDLSLPYRGVFNVSSSAMRDSLAEMMHP
ncbi:MAG: DUF4239 domain-containing protein [Rhizobiales bacterium]|nr:DUF4239 domain-containing protein [Hyphomicrobiales bacterium]